jgi:hypothetical protein
MIEENLIPLGAWCLNRNHLEAGRFHACRHGTDTVGPFRMAPSGIMVQARLMSDQKDLHGVMMAPHSGLAIVVSLLNPTTADGHGTTRHTDERQPAWQLAGTHEFSARLGQRIGPPVERHAARCQPAPRSRWQIVPHRMQ